MSGMYLMKQGLNPDSGAKARKHRAALPHSWAGSGPRTPSLLVACDKYSPAPCQPLAHLPLLPVPFAALSANILPRVSTTCPCLHSNRSLQHLKAFAGFCSANHLFDVADSSKWSFEPHVQIFSLMLISEAFRNVNFQFYEGQRL